MFPFKNSSYIGPIVASTLSIVLWQLTHSILLAIVIMRLTASDNYSRVTLYVRTVCTGPSVALSVMK